VRDAGGFDPLRPALVLPEVLDTTKWLDGFEAGFQDIGNEHLYAYEGRMTFLVYVNRGQIPESQLHSVDQLVDDRWKGMIVSTDPATNSAANAHAAHLLLIQGEDWVRKLLSQDLVIVNDNRQIVDFLVRGRYPIALGATVAILQDYQRHGTGLDVKPLAPESDLGARFTSGNGTVALMNKAPHPNAAKLFINWLLSQEGQATRVTITGENTRRLDVSGPSTSAARPGAYLKGIAREENIPALTRIMEIARSIRS
jgi:iron(III) transport system substrate-binding protein